MVRAPLARAHCCHAPICATSASQICDRQKRVIKIDWLRESPATPFLRATEVAGSRALTRCLPHSATTWTNSRINFFSDPTGFTGETLFKGTVEFSDLHPS